MPGFGDGPFGHEPFGKWPWSRQVLFDFLPSLYKDQDANNDRSLETWTESLRYSFDLLAQKITDWRTLRDPLTVRTQYNEVSLLRLGPLKIEETKIEQRGVDGSIDAVRKFMAPSARFRPEDLGKQLTLSSSAIPINNRTFQIAEIINANTVRCDPPLVVDVGPLRWQVQALPTTPAGILTVEIRSGDVSKVTSGWVLFDGSSQFEVYARQQFFPVAGQTQTLTLQEGKEGIVLADGRFQVEVPFTQHEVGKPLTISSSTLPFNNGKYEIFFVDAFNPSILQLHTPLQIGLDTNAGVIYTFQIGVAGVRVQHLAEGFNTPLSVSVSANEITVFLQTNPSGVQISTAAQVATAVNASLMAAALVSASFTGLGTGVAASSPFATIPGARLFPDPGPLVWALLPFPQLQLIAAAPPLTLIEQEGVDLAIVGPTTVQTNTGQFSSNDVGKVVVIRGSLLGQDAAHKIASVLNVNLITLVVSTPLVIEAGLDWEVRTLSTFGDFLQVEVAAPSMIQYLAQDFGIQIDTRESEARQRSWVENVTQWLDLKGLRKAYEIIGDISGFDVFIYELYRIGTALGATLPSDSVYVVGETGVGRFGANGRLFMSAGFTRFTSPTAIFKPSDVGVGLRILNANNPANDRIYTISIFVDPLTVELEEIAASLPDNGVLGTLVLPTILWNLVRIYTILPPSRPLFDDVNAEMMQAGVGVTHFLVDTYCWDPVFTNHVRININSVSPAVSTGVPIFYDVNATCTQVPIPPGTFIDMSVIGAVGKWRIDIPAAPAVPIDSFYVETLPVNVPGPPPNDFTFKVFSSVVPTLGPAELVYLCEVQESCDYCKSSNVLAIIEEGTITKETGIALEKVLERVIARLKTEVKPIHVELVPLFRRVLSTQLILTASISVRELYAIMIASLQAYYDILLGDWVVPDGPGLNATINTDPSPSVSEMSGLRLSLTTAVPVTSADVVGASTLYLTPYLSGSINLRYGSVWTTFSTAEVSLTLAGLTSGKNYDVFAYWSGSAVVLELSAAWTTDTARATALVRQDGVLVKSGDTTRLFVGTIRASAATTTEDSDLQRFVWNHFNRQLRKLKVTEATNTWAYTTAAYRATNGSAANAFEYVTGDAALPLSADAMSILAGSGAGAAATSGVGIDSTTVSSANIMGVGGDTQQSNLPSSYLGYPGLGYHKITWLEYGNTGASFIGDDGSPTIVQAGMTGEING